MQTWTQTFTFDRYGNRNFDEANTTFAGFDKLCSGNTVLCSDLKKRLNPSINTSNNRLSTSDDYAFDAGGNTTSDPDDRTFIYDAENKQVEVKDSLNATIGQYFYDGDGRRVKKVAPGGETTIFVYDAGSKLIGEYSTVVQTGSNAKTVYTTNDHLGSPRINTDATGQVISRHDYHPFGEEIARTGYGSDTIRKQFTGYERDGETGLDFAQARMYSNLVGRFLVPDQPFLDQFEKNPQSWNLYSYVRNNPLRLTDPSGTSVEDDDAGYFEAFRNWLVYGYGVSDETIKKMAQERRETLRAMGVAYQDQDGNVRLVDLDALSDFQVFNLARHVANLEESGELRRFSKDQLADAAAQDPIIPPVGIGNQSRAPKNPGGWKQPKEHADDVIQDTMNKAKEASKGLESGRHGSWMNRAAGNLEKEATAAKQRGDLPEYWQRLEQKAQELRNKAATVNHPGGRRP